MTKIIRTNKRKGCKFASQLNVSNENSRHKPTAVSLKSYTLTEYSNSVIGESNNNEFKQFRRQIWQCGCTTNEVRTYLKYNYVLHELYKKNSHLLFSVKSRRNALDSDKPHERATIRRISREWFFFQSGILPKRFSKNRLAQRRCRNISYAAPHGGEKSLQCTHIGLRWSWQKFVRLKL